MLKKFAVLMTVCAMAGCSEPEPIEIDVDEAAASVGLAPEDYEVDEHGNVKVYSKVETAEEDVLWYQDNLSEPVETVGMSDGDAIIASAGLDPATVEELADHEGEPKKLYTMHDDSAVSAWMSHSPNIISLNWFQFSDEPEAIERSQQSLKEAYKLARAMAGKEGVDAVMYISNGGKYRSKPVGGYPATGQCNDGVCFIHIDLSDV